MASTQRPVRPSPGDHAPSPPPVLRLRLVPWDVISAVALLAALLAAATATDWGSRLFGFLKDVCTGDDCLPVPYGVDFYIYPLVWGGLGAAIAAAVVGPVVSLLKGWYLSVWPLLAIALIVLSSVAGAMLTAFCIPYWHGG
jgi:hypothetical protein